MILLGRLSNINVAEVSLVSRAANQRKFLILKSEEGGRSKMNYDKTFFESILEKGIEDNEKIKDLNEDQKDLLKGMVNFFKEKLDKNESSKNENIDFNKIPEEMRDQVQKLWKQNEDMEKLLKAEKDERLKKEYISIAKEYTHLPIKADEFGVVLKTLAEVAPEEYKKVDELLKSVNKELEQSELLKEYGTSYEGGTHSDSWAKIEKTADQLVEKDPKLTKEEAITKVLEDHPDLYSEYMKEIS